MCEAKLYIFKQSHAYLKILHRIQIHILQKRPGNIWSA